MPVEIKRIEAPAVERLNAAWAQLYRFEVAALPPGALVALDQLAEMASPAGRAATVAKLSEVVLRNRCQVAGIETNDLYSYLPTVLDCNELRQLAEVSLNLYQQLFELYVQYAYGHSLQSSASRQAETFSIPNVAQLAQVLEPALLNFQAFHRQSRDWRAIGFLTTQLCFCNQWILKSLTLPEQYLLTPYLRFVEEYVAHPWSRVCAAGAIYRQDNPTLLLVERLMPLADRIAQNVYRQAAAALTTHVSRRGTLKHPGVRHSCVRDLKMFQSYLWLCVMEQDMAAIETELVRLCLMVFPSIGVKWELIHRSIDLLVSELNDRVTPNELNLIQPYTTGMQKAFANLYYPEAKS